METNPMTMEPTQTTEPTIEPVAPATTAGDPVEPVTPPPAATEPQAATEPEPAIKPEPGVRVVPQPSEYELPEGIPDHLRIFAHEKGFTQEQLSQTLEQFGGYMQGMEGANRTALRDMGEAHIKNWGAEGKTKLALAKAGLRQSDPEGKLATLLNESGFGNHPVVLEYLYNHGKSLQEGGFLKSTVQGPPGQKTAAEAMYGTGITKEK